MTMLWSSSRLAVLMVAALLVAGGSAWAQRGPIKTGMFVPLTGPLAANGKEMVKPEDSLKNPVYSREWLPCRGC